MDAPTIGRDDLIATAWSVLDRTGFEGFKVASVTRAAGISARAFYSHFDSKDDLLVELLMDESRRGAARIDRLVAAATTTSATAAVREWVAATTSAAWRPDLAPRVRLFAGLTQRIDGHLEAILKSREILRRSLVDAIVTGSRSGELASADPVADAVLIQTVCGATVNDLLAGRITGGAPAVVAALQDFALRALRAA